MRPLTALELLRVWEEGQDRPWAERALLLLAMASPDETPDTLALLPVGRRDERLLTLREWMFGPALTGVARCPSCAERLELSFSIADLRAGAELPPAEELSVQADGYEVRFRLPNTGDLAASSDARDGAAARQQLLLRCLLGARRNGGACSVKKLPARVLDAVVRRMGELDPQADVHTSLRCPACGHEWAATFDIVSFFWSEIESWSYRMLAEVHALASAYAWREADILALSPWRRQFYLGMVQR